jgi:hypothetical protein
MNVVHFSYNPISAAPFRLAQIQRLCGVNARVINKATHFHEDSARVYPCDVLIDEPESTLRPLLEGADIIHYHHHQLGGMLASQPWAWDVIKNKPSLVQFHVAREPEMETILSNPAVVKLVVAQYQVRQFPECIPVQNAIPIDDELHRPLSVRNQPPIVAFTPPYCHATGWGDKGCAETKRILQAGFQHRIVMSRPWNEAMAIRQQCDIAIDEVVTGSYHMCSLEALSQGLATVAGLDALTVDALEQVTGTRSHPWIVARFDTLRERLAELVADADYLQAKRAEARDYMDRYWHPEALVARFREIYEMVLERHSLWGRACHDPAVI